MKIRRGAAALALFVVLAALAGPVIAGGSDVPGIPPTAHKSKSVLSIGGQITLEPAPAAPIEDGIKTPDWLLRIASIIWGGGHKKK